MRPPASWATSPRRRRRKAGTRRSRRRCRSSRSMTASGSRLRSTSTRSTGCGSTRRCMDKIGGTEPKTFDDLIALLDKAKAAGVIPLALGGQNWQEADDVRLGRAVDRRAGVLQEGLERPRRGVAEVRHDEEVVRQPRQAHHLCRPQLLGPRLEPCHRHGHQGRRAGAGHGRLGQGRVRRRQEGRRARTSSATASRAPTAA